MATQIQLRVGVIGAGIAGLSAAIALRRAGHLVEVFEKSMFKQEIGAAIGTPPNATRILDRWGFDFERAQACEKLQIRMVQAETLNMVFRDSFSGMGEQYGSRWWSLHRVDLHQELRRLATSLEGHGIPAIINLGSEVAGIDCEAGIISLQKGSTVSKDLIIIADGTHCRFLELITGRKIPMVSAVMSVYRALVPFERIMKDENLRRLFENESPGFYFGVVPGKLQALVTYPCRKGELLNYAILHPTKEQDKEKDNTSWNHPATVEDALESIQDINPMWSDLCRASSEIKYFRSMHHEPLEKCVRGKVAMIGDSSHPMLPTHGQGAAMAIEDAVTLEVLFTGIKKKQDIESLLSTFQNLRVTRNVTTQILSNNPQFAPAELKARFGEMIELGNLSAKVPLFSKPYRDFFFTYDAFSEATKARAQLDSA